MGLPPTAFRKPTCSPSGHSVRWQVQPRPDVVVITGDLTECGLEAEYVNLARLIRKLADDAGLRHPRQP